jgi:hypothetical protein
MILTSMILPTRFLPRSEPIKGKSLMAKSWGKRAFAAFRISDFGFLSDFGLRISDLGLCYPISHPGIPASDNSIMIPFPPEFRL